MRFRKLFTLVFVLLAISSSLFSAIINVPDDYATIGTAVAASASGDVIQVASGTIVETSNISINKTNLTIQGTGSGTTTVQVSGTGYRFSVTAIGVTIKDMHIQKTDKTGLQNIIYIGASNFSLLNCVVSGQFVIGDGETSRAMEVPGGLSGLLIDGNTFFKLRQPGYFNGTTTGTISNNLTYGTKGWVLAGGDMTFTGNTWGSGVQANVYDIAILSTAPSSAYTNIVTMSSVNNDAVIEDQRVSPAVLSVVHVDASTSYSSDLGGKYHPYSTITPAITRVIAGGKIFVVAGTYHEQILINKSLTLNGSDGAVLDGTGVTGHFSVKSGTPTPVNGWTTGVKIKAGNVTLNNLDVTNFTQDGIICGYEASIPGNLLNIHITNSKISNIQPGWWGFGIYVGYESEGFGYTPPKLTAHLDYSGLLIENNEITNTHSSALVLQSFTGTAGTLQIKNNNIHHNTTNSGIWIDCARNLTIEKNLVEGNKWGIESSAYAETGYVQDGPYGPKNISILDNEIINNTEDGFALYNGWTSTFTINENKIFGNTPDVHNYLAGTLNAELNWWGDVYPSDQVTGNVDYYPCYTDAGMTTLWAPVHNITKDTFHATIQEAINAATSGNELLVDAASHTEGPQIVVDRNITLTGLGKLATVLHPSGNTGNSGDARGWFLVNAGITFNVSDLMLDGTGKLVYQCIRHKGTGSIESVKFTQIKYNESGPDYAGIAVAAFGTGALPVHFNDCDFSQIGRVGVLYYGTGVNGSVFENCRYTGKGADNWLDYALDISAGAQVTVKTSEISNCKGVASSDGSSSAGILPTTLYGLGTKATILNCKINNCTTGIAVGYNGSDVSQVIANYNNLSDNADGVTSTAPIVNAENNWWGDPTGPLDGVGTDEAEPGTCFDPATMKNDNGLGNGVSENIDYCPWLLGNVIWVPDPEEITSLGSGGKKTLAVKYLGGGSLPVYGYNVSFTWDAAKVDADHPLMGDIFPASIFQASKSGNSYTIQASWPGDNPGNPGPATLFTIDFTGVASGFTDLNFTTLEFRANLGGGSQAPITGISGDPGRIIIDATAPTVTSVFIDNLTLTYTDDYIKHTDAAKVTATVLDDNTLTIDDIVADLRPLGGGAAVKPDTYDPVTGLATWWNTALPSPPGVTCNPADGTLTITVTATDMVGKVTNGSDTIIADNTLPIKVTNFRANVTPTSGHRKVNLSWINGAETNYRGVVIRYRGWGDYPFYDAAAPVYPASITGGDGSVSTVPIAGTETVHTFTTDARDIYYYTAFACDMAGNISTVLSGDMDPRDRSTNYFLGDLGSGTGPAPGTGGYDGKISSDDLFMFSREYWKIGAALPEAIANIGPTVANKTRGAGNSYAIPNPNGDNKIEFEDMMIFSMNYGVVAPKLNTEPGKTADHFALELKGQTVEDQENPELIVRVHLANDGRDVKGASIKVTFDAECLKLLSIEKGRLFGMGEQTTFFMSRSGQNWLQFDASILGTGAAVDYSGDLAVLRFAVEQVKDAQIDIDSYILRDAENVPLNAQISGMSVSDAMLPTTYDMVQNYPNPFNPETTIQYQVPEACYVELVVYNANGQQVTTLVSELKEPGRYKVIWNGRDFGDRPVSSGLYYYRIKAGDYNKLLKMVFLK